MSLDAATRRELATELLLALADAVVAIAKRCPADRDIEAACGRVMAIAVRLRENRDPGRQVKDPPGFPPPAPGRVVARTPSPTAKHPDWDGRAPDLWAMAQAEAKKTRLPATDAATLRSGGDSDGDDEHGDAEEEGGHGDAERA